MADAAPNDQEAADAAEEVAASPSLSGAAADDAAAAKKRAKKARQKAAAAAAKLAELSLGGAAGGGAAAAGAPPPAPLVIGVPCTPPLQRGVTGLCDSYVAVGQTHPPTLPVASLFPRAAFPAGQECPYEGPQHASRVGSEEKRHLERLNSDVLASLREAAEVHRHVRKYAQSIIKPGIRLADMCEAIEGTNRALVREAGKGRGIAFPTGCSLNHVAAHYTPNPGDDTCLGAGDVMKVDFGVQINGHIIDCAWTVAFDPQFDPLLEAVKAATDAGIRAAGIDVRLGDIGAAIQEVMESYEVTLGGKTHRVRAIRNLSGHSIAPHRIHAGKSVPIVRTGDQTKMEELEHFAIETFGSTGRGEVFEDMECSHYMRAWEPRFAPLRLPRAKALLSHIDSTFGTLAFCRRWLERADGGSAFVHGSGGKQERYIGALKNLCDEGLVNAYPPLLDSRGSYTAQYEVRGRGAALRRCVALRFARLPADPPPLSLAPASRTPFTAAHHHPAPHVQGGAQPRGRLLK